MVNHENGCFYIFIYLKSVKFCRFTGTIVGNEDSDSRRWPQSKWRCLKVLHPIFDEAATHYALNYLFICFHADNYS